MKVETVRVRAPINRLFWYVITLGKWGERYHYRHKMVTRMVFSIVNSLPYAHNLWDNVPHPMHGTSQGYYR